MACRHTKIPVATEHGIEYAHAIVCGRRALAQAADTVRPL